METNIADIEDGRKQTKESDDPAERAGQKIGYICGVIVLLLVFALIIIGLMKLGIWLLTL